jgi:hypothetical protein
MATFNHAAALPWREFFYRDPFAGPGSIAKSSGMGLQISETRCPFPNGNNAGTDRLIPLRIFGSRQSALSFAAGDQTHRRFKADDKLLSFLDKL